MDFPTVDEVEHLHHHKSVEDKGHMPRIFISSLKHSLIIGIPVNKNVPSTSNSAHHSVLKVHLEARGMIKGIRKFGKEKVTRKHQNDHDCKLENTHSNHMFEHSP